MLSMPVEDVLIVHAGAGNHGASRAKYKKLIAKTLMAESWLEASRVLEESPLTNTGYGSSLNLDGEVECDAGFLRSKDNSVVNAGSMYNIRHRYPISETLQAYEVLLERYKENKMGLTMPTMIDHGRTEKFIKKEEEREESLSTDEAPNDTKKYLSKEYKGEENLITEHAANLYTRFKSSVPLVQVDPVTDTVGVIQTSNEETVVASSSGGNFFKIPGRIGCAAVLGASIALKTVNLADCTYSLACMCSGNGEDIMLMCLAKEIVASLSTKLVTSEDLLKDMVDVIIEEGNSIPIHNETKTIYVGAVCSIFNHQTRRTTILYCHSTESFYFGFRRATNEPEIILSTLETEPGKFCRGEFRT